MDRKTRSLHSGAMERVDIAVAGGGMVGICLAIGLAGIGARVALVERRPIAQLAESDGRGSAISAASQRLLQGLGLWAALAPDAQPIREIRVADGGARLHFDHRELDEGPLGWIVENAAIRRSLASALACSDVLVADGVRAAAKGEGLLALDNGSSLQAMLVIAADGRDSPLRTAAGIETLRWSYPQTAIVCAVAHELPHRGVAYEHFMPAGPFAILPMTGRRSSIVWTERATRAPTFLSLDAAAFAEELGRRFGGFLGRVTPVGRRWSYPLSVVHARRYIAPRLALAGDSAHAIHPIAGQGFNIGLRDVAALAEVVADALRLGLDPGADTVLARYERWRRADNLTMLSMTDALNRLFSNDIPPIRLIRGLGLAAVGRASPLRRLLMRHAMGLAGDLPRLTRGLPL